MTRLGRYISGAVLLAVIAALALLLHGCSDHRYPPDETCAQSGAWVYHHESDCGAITGPLLCPTVDRVLAAALPLCPAKDDDLRSDFAALRIDTYGYLVRCGGRPAYGCQDGSVISLATPTVLPDELGHVVWERCYGRTGEHTDSGRTVYDADFAAWLAALKDGGP